jgi:hypothetical protein
VHERLFKEGAGPIVQRVPHVHVVHDVVTRDGERKRQGWLRDLEWLKADCAAAPNDERACFYLAQTLDDLGRPAEAFAEYERRIQLGGWPEEVYTAMVRQARCAEAMGRDWSEVQQRYQAAHSYAPHRAEPVHALAVHFLVKKDYPLAFLFAQRAAQLPYPSAAALFVDREVYEFERHDVLGIVSFYVGEFKIGEEAVRRAMAARPERANLAKNLAFYLERPGAR